MALLVLAIVTRGYWLPERFAVNVPLSAVFGAAAKAAPEATVENLHLPPGFVLTRFANGLGNARLLRVTDHSDVVVSQPRGGLVTLLFGDTNQDGVSDGSLALLTGLDRPHGLALHDGWLYVAEMTAVGRIRFDSATRRTSGEFERVITGLPSGGNHWTRTIAFGPDAFLYVSVGSSCNVCLETDNRRAALLRYDPRTWRGSIYASGLRNAVGFAWRSTGPGAGGGSAELIATDNGRDLLGDDFPPCELNRVVEGGFYGWPFANGNRVNDPDFGTGHEAEIAATVPPIFEFAAHNAPLGIAFLDAPDTPAGYKGDALVALHGSWNRSRKDGYKVVSLHWSEDGRITQRDFLSGFLDNDTVSGRPVDIAQAADGTIYISDDFSGSIFKVAVGSQPARRPSMSTAMSGPMPGVMSAAMPSPRANSGAGSAAAGDPAAIARGENAWNQNRCIQCHDPKTMSQAAPKTTKVLEHLQAKYDVSRLVTYLKAPQPPMPLFELSEQERRDLALYVLNRYR